MFLSRHSITPFIRLNNSLTVINLMSTSKFVTLKNTPGTTGVSLWPRSGRLNMQTSYYIFFDEYNMSHEST